jgi:S1-C subfamily serine protease
MKHRSTVSAVLFVLSITIGVVPSKGQDLLPELVRRIKPSAVAIETFDSRGEKLSRGSGFFIESDRIVTNRHVIEGAYRAEIHS